MDLSNELISQISRWLEATNQKYCIGDFQCVMEAPDEHAVVSPAYLLVGGGGRFLTHFAANSRLMAPWCIGCTWAGA